MSGCECRVCGYYHPGEGCVIDDALVSKLARERDEARAEVERLRGALQSIADDPIVQPHREERRSISEILAIARAAIDEAMREGE